MSTEIFDNNHVKATKTSKIADDCAKSAEENETKNQETDLVCHNNSTIENPSLSDLSTFNDLVASPKTNENTLDYNKDVQSVNQTEKVNVENENIEKSVLEFSDPVIKKQTDLRPDDLLKTSHPCNEDELDKLPDDKTGFLELLSDSTINPQNTLQSESSQLNNDESDINSTKNEPSNLINNLKKQASKSNTNDSNEGDQMLGDLGEFSELNLNELMTDVNDEEGLFGHYFTNDDTKNCDTATPIDETSSKS